MKNFSFLILLLLSSYVNIAQSTDYYNRMNHVFGAIDNSKVTTGLLKEFGVRLNEVEAYDGSAIGTTNWVDKTQWQSLYHSLYSMRVGTATAMNAPATVYNSLKTQQSADPSIILLASQYYNYQQYKTNAYSNGDVTVSNDRIYDVVGRNPYETKTAFALTPLQYYLKGNGFSFKLQSNMMYTNSSLTLSSVEVDFGNGAGYQTLSINTAIYVSYSSGGEKELKARFTYINGPTLYSHSKLYVNYFVSQSQARFNGPSVTPFSITGAVYNGLSATGNITVETAGTDGILDKPLIIVEGFDPENAFDYFDLINDADVGGINRIINLSTGLTLNQAIENIGYDLVFIDFRNSTDFLQRNAYMVEEVIQWVNNHKTGSEKNVVVGMSMGGLVARYALRHMETTSRTHQTKLYVSHDVPHQGANVPIAFQSFVRHLSGESVSWPVFLSLFDINIVNLVDIAPDLETGLNLLQSPAAQQMLIYQLQNTGGSTSINTNPLHSSFASEYQSLGYPQQGGIKNIAISNGSECGTPLNFAPYASLADIDQKVDLPWFTTNIVFTVLNVFSLNPIRALTSFLATNTDVKAEFNMRALPNQQSQQIYSGKVFIKKTVLGFINVEEMLIGQKTLSSTASMLPLDNGGGGIYDISQFVTLPPQLSQFILQTRFSFVPSYSSLDIGAGSQSINYNDLARTYSPASPPLSPKNTPFHNFFTNPIFSENHIQFTLNNGNWFLTELQGNAAFYTCAATCSSPPVLQISGPDFICSNASITLANPLLAPVSTVWSTSNPSQVSINASTGYATQVGGFKGPTTVTATINSGCGGSISSSKSIWVGEPIIDGINGPTSVCPDPTMYYFYTGYVSGNPSVWQWFIPGDVIAYNNILDYQEVGISFDSDPPSANPGTRLLELVVYNECGPADKILLIDVPYSCFGGFAMSPNPTNDNVEISISSVENKTAARSSDSILGKRVIRVYDKMGTPLSTIETADKTISIPTNHLTDGIYIMEVSDGSKTSRKLLTVKH